MTHGDVVEQLDKVISSRSILGHPFYVAWRRGELTREQLRTYATLYYPHVAAFPGYLAAAIARADDPMVRSELERNLADEVSHPKPHSELWLDFAEELGVDRRTVASDPPCPSTAAAITTFTRVAATGTPAALAALYAYESQQPEVSREKCEGLRGHYGVCSDRALAYFQVHATIDVEHRQGERQALTRCLAAGASADALLRAADEGLSAYWQLLDGIHEKAGIAMA
jgi:pyrroloquinoline-quinone synthase